MMSLKQFIADLLRASHPGLGTVWISGSTKGKGSICTRRFLKAELGLFLKAAAGTARHMPCCLCGKGFCHVEGR